MNEDQQLRLNPLRNAPNLLTLMRMCMAPFLVAAILEGHFLLSFILFVAAGLTDGLDGLLARVLKQRSVLGHYLDPVADKLLLSTLFLVLFYKGLIPGTVTVLVFGRDVGILLVSAILYAAVGRREFYPSIFGKANTLAQISAVAAVLLHQVAPSWYWVTVTRHRCSWRYHRAYDSVRFALCMAGFAPDGYSGRQRRWREMTFLAGPECLRMSPARTGAARSCLSRTLGFVRQLLASNSVFNLHIAKFFGVEDFAALQALDVLSVVVPGNDPDFGVFAGGCHRSSRLVLL